MEFIETGLVRYILYNFISVGESGDGGVSKRPFSNGHKVCFVITIPFTFIIIKIEHMELYYRSVIIHKATFLFSNTPILLNAI